MFLDGVQNEAVVLHGDDGVLDRDDGALDREAVQSAIFSCQCSVHHTGCSNNCKKRGLYLFWHNAKNFPIHRRNKHHILHKQANLSIRSKCKGDMFALHPEEKN